MANLICVQTLFLKHFVAPKNSEYRSFWQVKKMEDVYPVQFRMLDNVVDTVVGNGIYALTSVLFRTTLTRRLVLTKFWRGFRRVVILPQWYLYKTKADVIWSKNNFPITKVNIPIIFEADFNIFGVSHKREEVKRLLYFPRWMIERSAFIMVKHEVSLRAFIERFPEFAWKAVLIPHYLPALEAVSEEVMHFKFERFGRPKIKILFVGNMAKLKGLPELVNAYDRLKKRYNHIELTVVSDFRDGAVELPSDVKQYSNLSFSDVYRLMRESHILAILTKAEPGSHVCVEAMANGCSLLIPNVSPHDELYGRFGVVANPMSWEDIARALEQMINNRELCMTLASKGREEFMKKYHHSIVGSKYYELFRMAAAGGKPMQDVQAWFTGKLRKTFVR